MDRGIEYTSRLRPVRDIKMVRRNKVYSISGDNDLDTRSPHTRTELDHCSDPSGTESHSVQLNKIIDPR
jgi:hypothetical protein